MLPVCEKKGPAAVSWLKGVKHKFYEDRYRLLSNETPLVRRLNRGELFAVFDGIGSAPEGMWKITMTSPKPPWNWPVFHN